MTLDELVEQTLRLSAPGPELSGLVRGLVFQGFDPDVLQTEMERMHGALQDAGREREADHVADLLDLFVGWCSASSDLRRDPLFVWARERRVAPGRRTTDAA